VVSISAGHPFRNKIPEVIGSGIRVVQMRDVTVDSGINWETCVETSVPGKRKPDWLKFGDILFVARGNHNFAVLVDHQDSNFQSVVAPHFFLLQRNDELVWPAFIVWFLNQQPSQSYFQRESEGSQGKSIRRSVLESTPIVVPDLIRQKQIVKMDKVLRREKFLLGELISNGELLMNAIAADLVDTANKRY